MFQLAAAEAEAEALRRELAARKGNRDTTDLSKLKPATPEKRIDGTGYRETLFSGPKATGVHLLHSPPYPPHLSNPLYGSLGRATILACNLTFNAVIV